MSICCFVQVLEQAFFLGSQSVLVCLAWIATQKTLWVATVHGMTFGQSMRLFNVQRIVVCSGNFDLPRHSHISLVSSSAVDKSGQFVAHPPRPTVRCTGLPAIMGVPDRLVFALLPVLVLASG